MVATVIGSGGSGSVVVDAASVTAANGGTSSDVAGAPGHAVIGANRDRSWNRAARTMGIARARGDVPVERLAVAECVVGPSGGAMPMPWLDHRHAECRGHLRPRGVRRVQVRARCVPRRCAGLRSGAPTPPRGVRRATGTAFVLDAGAVRGRWRRHHGRAAAPFPDHLAARDAGFFSGPTGGATFMRDPTGRRQPGRDRERRTSGVMTSGPCGRALAAAYRCAAGAWWPGAGSSSAPAGTAPIGFLRLRTAVALTLLLLIGGLVTGCQSATEACGGLGPATCLMFGLFGHPPTQTRVERPGFTPPRPVACYDHELLGLPDALRSGQAWGTPAGHDRERDWGFSIVPPGGDNWCVRRIVRPVPWQVVFAKNMYGSALLSALPPRRQRQHTFIAFAEIDEQERPFDLEPMRRTARGCGFGCRMISADIQKTDRVRAQCLRLDRVFQTDLMTHQFLYECIHPWDPRLMVRWGFEESWRAGAPFYTPPLTERLRPEYEVMLNSLELTPVDFANRRVIHDSP